MKVILKNISQEYFVGYYENKFLIKKIETSEDLQKAQIFDVTLNNGKPIFVPDPPDEGEWDVIAVNISLKNENF